MFDPLKKISETQSPYPVAAIFSPNFSPNNTQTSTADRCLLLVQRKGNNGNGLVIEIIECIKGKTFVAKDFYTLNAPSYCGIIKIMKAIWILSNPINEDNWRLSCHRENLQHLNSSWLCIIGLCGDGVPAGDGGDHWWMLYWCIKAHNFIRWRTGN